jgi:outer membrane receptor for ferrienterochelin and colicins
LTQEEADDIARIVGLGALKYFILNAGLGVENLFDWVDDRPWNTKKPYSTITPGRAFYASLTIRFRK